jgi:xylulokinase
MPDAEGFLRWATEVAPGAAGYWPCQAVATNALTGVPAVDATMTGSMGRLYRHGEWQAGLLEQLGAGVDQMPVVVPMFGAGGTVPGTDTVFAGGTIDAMCDQLVAGASEPGDVLAIFGATLVAWVVTDRWIEVPGLITMPHTVAGRVLVGGPSNAGALFVDWARRLLRQGGRPRPGAGDGRHGSPEQVPVWLPYLRGERTPFNDVSLRASVHGLDIGHGPAALERAAYEASGFVLRRLLEWSDVPGRRVVASGGGSASAPWMAAVADATGLPVDSVAVPEGAALGAAFLARLAAGLAGSLEESGGWARVGHRYEPDPAWTAAAARRFIRFTELGPTS